MVKGIQGDWYDDMTWLGGRQRDYPSSKAWSWVDGQPFKYTNWDPPGEPNNVGGNEQCIEMYTRLGARVGKYENPKKWNDVACSTKMKSFVCKR
ncbi:lectin C-type domain protein [Teladorsagia circumcincta]|uniref:Lectin C-type domain protein n=1 Tax=Teladorsagia circumcincta TaxID=45464 RepID=A0A2G9TJX7_TELCI|nr:lectin C-type domain protein [Teladorsagia circumcincta]